MSRCPHDHLWHTGMSSWSWRHQYVPMILGDTSGCPHDPPWHFRMSSWFPMTHHDVLMIPNPVGWLQTHLLSLFTFPTAAAISWKVRHPLGNYSNCLHNGYVPPLLTRNWSADWVCGWCLPAYCCLYGNCPLTNCPDGAWPTVHLYWLVMDAVATGQTCVM